MKMKICINNNEKINIMAILMGGMLIFIEKSSAYLTLLKIIFPYLVLGVIILAVIRNIPNLFYYILIDGETITLYRGRKPIKQIKLENIKSIVLCQQTFRKQFEFNPNKFFNNNIFILVNDGTFLNKKWAKWSLRKKMLSNSEGWIAIEFSSNRYAAFKHLLPNCEIETCTIYG